MIKNMKYVIIAIVAFILILVAFKVLPNVSLKEISQEELSELSLGNKEDFYICRLSTYTGPEWIIIGDKNGLFDNQKPEEQVIIEGDFMPFLFRNKQDDIYSKTNFVIKAKVKEKKPFTKSDPTQYRVLKAKKWYVFSND